MAPPAGPNAPDVTEEAVTARVSLDVDSALERIRNTTARMLSDLSSRGLSGQEMADAISAQLADLSQAPNDLIGRGAVTRFFNLGRNLAAQRNAGVISTVTRTAVLDENTCDPCVALDGQKYEVDSDAYFADLPPAKCEGGDKCRCFMMYEVA